MIRLCSSKGLSWNVISWQFLTVLKANQIEPIVPDSFAGGICWADGEVLTKEEERYDKDKSKRIQRPYPELGSAVRGTGH